MNSKQKKTLLAVFSSPPPTSVPWAEVESLLIAVGATVSEGQGSRVKFDCQGVTLAIHRPHNPKTARSYQLELVRSFLEAIGVAP